jgi:hypothetical protein
MSFARRVLVPLAQMMILWAMARLTWQTALPIYPFLSAIALAAIQHVCVIVVVRRELATSPAPFVMSPILHALTCAVPLQGFVVLMAYSLAVLAMVTDACPGAVGFFVAALWMHARTSAAYLVLLSKTTSPRRVSPTIRRRQVEAY